MTPLTLVLAAGWVVVMNPPEPRSCATPGWNVRLPAGGELRALRMVALPGALGIEITPESAGRVHCSGFEDGE